MKYLKVKMKVPTGKYIYAPDGEAEVSDDVKRSRPVRGLVSFEPDGESNPVEVDFYGYGLDRWYIKAGE